MKKVQGKVCVVGENLLPREKAEELAGKFRKNNLRAVEFDEADVFIFVVGSDPEKKLHQKARELGKYYFSLLPYHDTILGNWALSIAVLPEHAAKWARSLIDTPDKPLTLD